MSSRVDQILSQLNPNHVAGEKKDVVTITSRTNGVAVITINNPPVNSLHPSVQEGIGKCYEEACNDASIKAVVFTGTGVAFMAGADIEYVASLQKKGAKKQDVFDYIKGGNDIFNRLESGPKPTVAAVNGIALGGGCELSMACNARIAVATATFGQPELNLGIIPGLGGTQRFPRLIGLQKGIQFTLTGKTLKAGEAQKLGLIDAIVKPNDLIATACKVALDIADGKQPRRQALLLTDKLPKDASQVTKILDGARETVSKKFKNVPHGDAYLQCVEVGVKEGGKAGIAKEIDLISDLIPSPSAKGLIHFFFASRASSKVPDVPAKPTGPAIQRVAVLGGGTMGAGICIAYLLKGYDVILKEINEKFLLAGVERIINDLNRIVKARKLPTMAIEVMMRKLTPQITYDGFDKVDLVVEAVLENIQLKQNIFVELEKVCPKHAILATNTSTIDVELIGSKTKAQDRILGLHYFSPAHVMPLLEIVRTKYTSANTLSHALAMSKRLGKTPVVVGNCVGFTANRAFFPYGQAASLLVDAGMDPYRIDRALEKFGMPMGVFRMSDLSGIDIFMHVNSIINSAYGARCYNSTLGKKLFEKQRFGQKTGCGYYKYQKGKPVPDPETLAPFLKSARSEVAGPLAPVDQLTDEQIVQIILFPVINESLRIVQEGHVLSKGDVDVATVFGYGFPAYRGGVLFWGENAVGWKKVRDTLKQLSETFGAKNEAARKFFAPSEYLEKLAA